MELMLAFSKVITLITILVTIFLPTTEGKVILSRNDDTVNKLWAVTSWSWVITLILFIIS